MSDRTPELNEARDPPNATAMDPGAFFASGPDESLTRRAVLHWCEVGVRDGLVRAAARLQLEMSAEEQPRYLPVEEAWVQRWSGGSRAELSLHMSADDEDDLIHGVLATSTRPVEPSREIVMEVANLVLNGLSATLSRALDLKVQSSLPRRLTQPRGVEVVRTAWIVRIGQREARMQVSLRVPEAELSTFRRRLGNSLAAMMELAAP